MLSMFDALSSLYSPDTSYDSRLVFFEPCFLLTIVRRPPSLVTCEFDIL